LTLRLRTIYIIYTMHYTLHKIAYTLHILYTYSAFTLHLEYYIAFKFAYIYLARNLMFGLVCFAKQARLETVV